MTQPIYGKMYESYSMTPYMHYVICNHFPGENIGNKISESQIRIEFLQVFPQHSIVTFQWSQNRPRIYQQNDSCGLRPNSEFGILEQFLDWPNRVNDKQYFQCVYAKYKVKVLHIRYQVEDSYHSWN